MSELAEKIYNHLQASKQYTYSQDVVIKQLELQAVDELEKNDYIYVTGRAIGYVLADVL